MLLTKKQTQALNTPKGRINLYYGSVRSGKTHFSLIEWALFVASCPQHMEFLMVGKTLSTLNKNCLRLLQQLEPSFTYSLNMKCAKLYGRTIWLEGANDERSENKIRGITLQGAYIDELTLTPESFYRMILTRLSVKGAKLFATTNPDSPSHYVYVDIIKNDKIKKCVIKFTLDDNDFLDPEYVREIKLEHTGVFYERFILGNFVRAEGIIYYAFAMDAEPFMVDQDRLPNISMISVGIDYGASRAKSTFKAVGFTSGFRDVVVLAERDITTTNDPEQLYKAFDEFIRLVTAIHGRVTNVFADWGGLGQVITQGLIIYCKRNNIPVAIQDCEKGRIIDRVHLTLQLMAQGRMKVCRACPNMVEAFRGAVWNQEDGHEDERLDDGSSDIDSLDAFEYAIWPFAERLGFRRGGN